MLTPKESQKPLSLKVEGAPARMFVMGCSRRWYGIVCVCVIVGWDIIAWVGEVNRAGQVLCHCGWVGGE